MSRSAVITEVPTNRMNVLNKKTMDVDYNFLISFDISLSRHLRQKWWNEYAQAYSGLITNDTFNGDRRSKNWAEFLFFEIFQEIGQLKSDIEKNLTQVLVYNGILEIYCRFQHYSKQVISNNNNSKARKEIWGTTKPQNGTSLRCSCYQEAN